jgi:hypothetical protein
METSMKRSNYVVTAMQCLLLLGFACSTFAQQPDQQRGQGGPGGQGGQGQGPAAKNIGVDNRRLARPPLFFKEEWKQPAGTGQHVVTADAVSNPNLELKFYGPFKDAELNGIAGNEGNPMRIWMGACGTPCGGALRDKNNYVDLRGLAKIRWVTRVSGFHKLRPLLKLSDGTYLVGDHADGETSDFHETEFSISDVHWLKLDIEKVIAKGDPLDNVDLSKVDEVGWVDLMPGSGHGDGGNSVLVRFAVYGKPVPRDAAVQSGAN